MAIATRLDIDPCNSLSAKLNLTTARGQCDSVTLVAAIAPMVHVRLCQSPSSLVIPHSRLPLYVIALFLVCQFQLSDSCTTRRC